jgi:hypothetical protein
MYIRYGKEVVFHIILTLLTPIGLVARWVFFYFVYSLVNKSDIKRIIVGTMINANTM